MDTGPGPPIPVNTRQEEKKMMATTPHRKFWSTGPPSGSTTEHL